MYRDDAGKISRFQLIAALAVAVLVLVVGAVWLRSGAVTPKRAKAFGKLPAPAAGGRTAAAALGMPAMEMFPMVEYEYVWTGGAFPDMGATRPVYRRRSDKITLDDAKALARKFGITGEPQPDEPGSVPGGEPGVEPSGGASEPTLIAPAPERDPGPGSNALPRPEPAPEPAPAPEEKTEPRPEPAPEPPAKIYNFFDEASGRRLMLFEGDGRYQYSVDGALEPITNDGEGPPKADEAKTIAKEFLEDKGLLPENITGPFVVEQSAVVMAEPALLGAPDGVVSSKPVPPGGPAFIDVQFGRKLGGYDVVEFSGEPSRGAAVVTIGPDRKVIGAYGELPSALDESPYPVIGTAAAFEELKKQPRGSVEIMGGARTMIAPEPLGAEVPAPAEGGAGATGEGSAGSGVVADGSGTVEPDLVTTEPAPVEPPKPRKVKIEFNKVEVGYVLAYAADGPAFFQPAYVFSGKNTDDGSDYRVAVPAVVRDLLTATP